MRARHILVETEDEAKAVLAELKKGADFAELAKAKSKDPGSADGGDLGYFTKDQMVPEFAEVAFKLDKGELSDPVKSQFGWHVIKVEDKRERQPPEFDKVKDAARELSGAQVAERADHQAARRRPRSRRLGRRGAGSPGARRAAGRAEEVELIRRTARCSLTSMPGRRAGHLRLAHDPEKRMPAASRAPVRRRTGYRDVTPSLRSRRNTFPTCRRSPACASRPARPASSTRAAPTCCSRCSTRAPRSPACSPARNVRRRRSSGAAPSSRAARRARWWSIPATPTPSPARPAATRPRFTAKLAAKAAGCKPAEVFLASTGVIGEPLPAERFDGVMDRAGRRAPRPAASTKPPKRS